MLSVKGEGGREKSRMAHEIFYLITATRLNVCQHHNFLSIRARGKLIAAFTPWETLSKPFEA